GGGLAFADGAGDIRTGATALLVRALLQRGSADPALLRDLGTFLAGQVRDDGAVLAGWDPVSERPFGEPNPFFTGETYWALLGLAAFDGFDAAAARIGDYLPGRDDAEDR